MVGLRFGGWGCNLLKMLKVFKVLFLTVVEQGLQHAWDLGYKEVACFSDCMSVVEVVHSTMDV